MRRALRGAPKQRSCALSAWSRWTAWSTSVGWCTSQWSWPPGRRLTSGVRRRARRGTRRSLWLWCATRTCRPCRRDGTDTCPLHTWAAQGRMRSFSDEEKPVLLLESEPIGTENRTEDTRFCGVQHDGMYRTAISEYGLKDKKSEAHFLFMLSYKVKESDILQAWTKMCFCCHDLMLEVTVETST